MTSTQKARSPRSFSDYLPALGALAATAFLLYRFLLPQASAPLEGLQGEAVAALGPVRVVELAATHCPSCLAMKPIVERVEQAYRGRATVQVLYLDKPEDRAEATQLAARAAVRYTPTFIVIDRTGQAVAKFIGPTSYVALASALDEALAGGPAGIPGNVSTRGLSPGGS
jgi:thiol-disulfide isomerase/thioredoxin